MTDQGGVSLNKVSLTKAAPTVSLTKGGAAAAGARITINLNWQQGAPKKSGFMSIFSGAGGGDGIDLDLGCLYEMADGKKSVVQALGDSFGSFDSAPYIKLDKDDRSGQNTEGENLFLNPAHSAEIKRILVYTFIYEGAANWAVARPVVTVKQEGGPAVEVILDEADPSKKMCAIAMITNRGGGELDITREVQYFPGHRAMDEHYGWGLKWVTGHKD